MAIYNMVGGGSSANLSILKVSEKPVISANVGTIAVVTTGDINVAYYQPSQPFQAEEGDVWLVMNTSAAVQVPLSLKKVEFLIGLAACQQYVSGSWVSKDVYVYDGTQWLSPTLKIFYDGSTGFTFSNITATARDLAPHTFTVDSTIYVNTYGGSYYGNADSGRWDATSAAFDVTPYRTLYVCASVSRNMGTYPFGIGLTTNRSNEVSSSKHQISEYCSKYITSFAGTGSPVSVDISSLTGNYYLLMGGTYNQGYQADGGYTVTISRIYLQ